jgi:hypothetical protein
MKKSLHISPRIRFFVLAIGSISIVALLLAAPPGGSGHATLVEPEVAGCSVFPIDNIWNAPVDTLPLDPNSDAYIASIGEFTEVHPDFGTVYLGSPIGIPYVIVPGTQPKVPITFEYDDESDPGPYPIPPNPPMEGGSDRHILVIDRDNCILYEVYRAYLQPNGTWDAGSGAIFDLCSNDLRPDGWTSADAAGLSIFAGLVRYDEVAGGEIKHALRFTAENTRKAHIWPARHDASDLTGAQYPPMGQRFRLRGDFPIDPNYSNEVKVIMQAMKKYGIILADNGSDWYVTGAPDSRWNDEELVEQLADISGADFEAVDVSSLMIDPDSGRVPYNPPTPPMVDLGNNLYLPITRNDCG